MEAPYSIQTHMPYNVVCAGEALIDLISVNYAAHLADARGFVPHVGGSPANLARNLRMLGQNSGLICGVGSDALGQRILESFRDSGLPTDLVEEVRSVNTTLVMVTKSKGNPDFEVYRGADHQLSYTPFQRALDIGSQLFHTTCFALSLAPMRSHLLRAGAAFAKTGTTLSLDANYATKVWPDRERARAMVLEYVEHGALLKMSDVDYERLYDTSLAFGDARQAARPLLDAGARLVCFTFSAEGAVAVTAEGSAQYKPAPADIVDATGAGDSFWAGFLAAYLGGCSSEDCLEVAAKVAAVKLQQHGPLRHELDWRSLLTSARAN